MIGDLVGDKNVTLFGTIQAVHGVNGQFVIQTAFSMKNCKNIVNNVELIIKNAPAKLVYDGFKGDGVIVSAKNIQTREHAVSMLKTPVYAYKMDIRRACDMPDDEIYGFDLYGLDIIENGVKTGTIKRVVNFGAGDLAEVEDLKGGRDFIQIENLIDYVDLEKKLININNLDKDEIHT
jgi:16S rRNA processing protein RimM